MNNAGVGIGEAVGEITAKKLLTLSPGCVIPEIVFQRPGGELIPQQD